MNASIATPLAKYLSATHRSDREYLDGEVVEHFMVLFEALNRTRQAFNRTRQIQDRTQQ